MKGVRCLILESVVGSFTIYSTNKTDFLFKITAYPVVERRHEMDFSFSLLPAYYSLHKIVIIVTIVAHCNEN